MAFFSSVAGGSDSPEDAFYWSERLMLVAWAGLFVLTVLLAAGTRDLRVFSFLLAVVVPLGFLGLIFSL